MPEASASEVLELHFDHRFRRMRARSPDRPRLHRPGPACALSGKPQGLDHVFELLRQDFTIFALDRRGETYVIEFAFIVLNPEP
jgi:hypothetical protein